MNETPVHKPQAFSAAFCSMRAGDVLVHPRTKRPIATVEQFKHTAVERKGKPRRYTVTLVLDEI